MDLRILKSEERAVFALRSLYRQYGYSSFRMSKFEEYEYYIRNKDFLTSDRIITFNDTNGKLLALKPDVTLSIVKKAEDAPGFKQKLYYNENIYRVSESTGRYKEIMQAGLECIGDIDLYDTFEVVSLAAKSLGTISCNFILQISHLGILSSVLNSISTDSLFQQTALSYISGKNTHDLYRLCEAYGIAKADAERLCGFVKHYGDRTSVIDALEEISAGCADEPIEELKELSALLDRLPGNERILFDFSVIHNMNYYNGIVFSGFVEGISDGVLVGGRYDKLMSKLNRKSGAIGFAVYLDLLEQLTVQESSYDVDVLLVYSDDVSADAVCNRVEQLIAEGKTVSAQRTVPEKIRYKELIKM